MLSYLLVAALIIGQADAGSKSRTISMEEARGLVYALLASTGCTVQKCEVHQRQDDYFPALYFLDATWPNPTGSPRIGSWAVNPKTAVLWDANSCIEYRNSRVIKAQMVLRKRIGLTEAALAKLKGRPPGCEPEEKVEYRENY